MSDKTNENNKNIEIEPLQQAQDQLEKANQQAKEYLDSWKRERADFINYKKEEAKRVGEFIKFANEGIFLEMMEVLDNVEIAKKHIPEKIIEDHEEWLEGLEKALAGFEELLSRYGIEKIPIKDQKFNPVLHEAVNGGEGEDIEEVRAGYTMHGKVIRPARVKILSKN